MSDVELILMTLLWFVSCRKWSGQVGYIFRPYEAKTEEKAREKMLLAGYGVELQFKSTEYKAQDDSGPEGQGKLS